MSKLDLRFIFGVEKLALKEEGGALISRTSSEGLDTWLEDAIQTGGSGRGLRRMIFSRLCN